MKQFKRESVSFCNSPYPSAPAAHTIHGVNAMKEDEKKPNPWEAVDPKPPVIQSGHMEGKVHNLR